MKATLDFETGHQRLDRALQMELLTTKKTAREIAERAYRGVIRNVFAITPPMGGKSASIINGRTDFAGGLEAGRRAIRADLRRAFKVLPDQYKNRPHAFEKKLGISVREILQQSTNELVGWYLSLRNRSRRVTGKHGRPVFRSQLAAVEREVQKRQGLTAAGWVPAAQKYGAPVPVWIKRWAGTAGGRERTLDSADGVRFEAVNPTDHANSSDIQRRLDYAFSMQAGKIESQLKNYARKKL